MVGPLGFWRQLQHYHLEILQKNGLCPEHRLLDIGCGPLQGGVAFIRYLERDCYVGFDIDPRRIEAALQQIVRHRLAVKAPRVFVSSSFANNELKEETFDFMWASQILYYFNDMTLGKLMAMICRRLSPGGKFLGDTLALEHYEFRFPEHPGGYVRHTPASLRAVAEPYGLRVRCLGQIGAFGYPKRLSLRDNLLFEITQHHEASPRERRTGDLC